jgi:transposase
MVGIKHDAATVAATSGEAMERIEIVGERRRAHDLAFRARVVAESAIPGARVQAVAARYGICPSLIYRWRREGGGADAATGSSVHLFPVRIEAAPESSTVKLGSRAVGVRPPGIIEIELGNGVRVSVDEGIGVAALRRVVSVLRG